MMDDRWNDTFLENYNFPESNTSDMGISGVSGVSDRYSDMAFSFVLVALGLLILWTLFGNIMVWFALYKFNHLKTLSNYLIGNLAISDFLLALFVLPMSGGYDLLGWWCFGETMCYIWLSIDVLCCTASIWGLVVISIDRLTATIYPIWYRDQRKKQRAALYIASVWIFSILVSIVPSFIGKGTLLDAFSPGNDTSKPQCILFQDPSYVVYSSSGSFFIPLIIMAFVYMRIFIEIRKRIVTRAPKKKKRNSLRKRSDISMSSFSRFDKSDNSEREGMSVIVETEYSDFYPENSDSSNQGNELNGHIVSSGSDLSSNCGHSESGVLLKDESTSMKSGYSTHVNDNEKLHCPIETVNRSVQTSNAKPSPMFVQSDGNSNQIPLKTATTNGAMVSPQLSPTTNGKIGYNSNELGVYTNLNRSSPSIVSSDSMNNFKELPMQLPKQQRHVSIDESCHKNRHQKKASLAFLQKTEKAKKKLEEKARRRFERREERATRIMATIMACFIVCWLPFFIMYVTRGFCPKCPLSLDGQSFIIWLGYANSGLNPILYTIFNEEFRSAFRHVLCPSGRRIRT